MPPHDIVIEDLVQGDDFEINRNISKVPVGQLLVLAWLTIKEFPVEEADAEAIIQKAITTTNNPGTGQVTDADAGDGVGSVRFDLVPADTILLDPATTYHWDIQVCTDADFTYTPTSGTIKARQEVTRTLCP